MRLAHIHTFFIFNHSSHNRDDFFFFTNEFDDWFLLALSLFSPFWSSIPFKTITAFIFSCFLPVIFSSTLLSCNAICLCILYPIASCACSLFMHCVLWNYQLSLSRLYALKESKKLFIVKLFEFVYTALVCQSVHSRKDR